VVWPFLVLDQPVRSSLLSVSGLKVAILLRGTAALSRRGDNQVSVKLLDVLGRLRVTLKDPRVVKQCDGYPSC